jgi:transposase-like protein
MSSVEEFLTKIRDAERKISSLESEKRNWEKLVKVYKKDLYNFCEHDWIRDWGDRDSRSRWECKNCGLSRHVNY